MTDQEKKTEEELQQEIIKEHNLDIEDEKDKKILDSMMKDKVDRYDATNQKKKAQESLDDMTKGKDFYKEAAKTAKPADKKSEQQPNGQESNDKPLISEREISILFGKSVLKNETELKHLEKVMKDSGKSAKDALKDSLFTTWRDNNDKLITRQGSLLPASQGGGNRGEAEEDAEFTKKAEEALNPDKKSS